MSDFFATYGTLFVFMTIMAVLALSQYLPLMAGQLSLATPAFYAVGGYTAAILSTQVLGAANSTASYPVIFLLIEIGVAAAVCALLGVLVGVPALRLRGIYLALATIAFVEILRVLALTVDFTGGAVGIFGVPQPFANQTDYLWLTIPVLVLVALAIYQLQRSPTGRAFDAIRDDELAAGVMGVNTTFAKVLAFTLSAVVAGVIGVLSAHYLNTWNARQGTFDVSVAILAFVLVGGSRTVLGPIVGAMLLTALPEVLRAISGTPGLPDWLMIFLRDGRTILYGVLIVLCAVTFPRGLITPELLRTMMRMME